MSFSIRFLRKIAVAKATLFLWLFGFAVGIAHACVTVPGAGAQATSNQVAGEATQASDDCDDAVAQQACITTRELEQASVVKAKSQPGADSTPAVAAIPPWSGFAALAPPRVWHVAAAPPPGPPVAILFLRLIN